MQTVLASSLRYRVGFNIRHSIPLGIVRLATSTRSSSSFGGTTRYSRRSTFTSDLSLWSTAHRSQTVLPRGSLVRAFSNHPKASSYSPSSPPSTSSEKAAAVTDQVVQSPTSQPLHQSESPASTESHPTMNGTNPTSPRTKRKTSPFDAIESGRPSKHHRLSLNGRHSAGDNTPDVEATDLEMHDEFIDEAALQQVLPAMGPDSFEWQATIENVVRNVVSIRFCQTCSFDTDPALNSEATGFVVDAERGYILTNRHVVGSGPFWGYVVFDNHEEVDAYPVYRDPVHDFGILKFNPKAIKYMPVEALALRPDLAKGRISRAHMLP